MFPWCCYILLQVAPFSFFARKLLLRGNGDISFEGGELCNQVPVRDSYFEGAERECLRVGRCFDCVGSAKIIKRIAPLSEWSCSILLYYFCPNRNDNKTLGYNNNNKILKTWGLYHVAR